MVEPFALANSATMAPKSLPVTAGSAAFAWCAGFASVFGWGAGRFARALGDAVRDDMARSPIGYAVSVARRVPPPPPSRVLPARSIDSGAAQRMYSLVPQRIHKVDGRPRLTLRLTLRLTRSEKFTGLATSFPTGAPR